MLVEASASRRAFFYLHGDHSTLPRAELSALLEARGTPPTETDPLPRVLRCRAPIAVAEEILKRAYMTRFGAEELFNVSDDTDTITRAVRDELVLEEMDRFFTLNLYQAETREDRSFAGSLKEQVSNMLKERVREHHRGSSDNRYVGVMSGRRFLFGRLLDAHPQLGLASRSPHIRPFFHPSALSPKLAGCMVNLTRIRENQLLLDPFCGVGSILIEAALLNCQVIGSDIDARMVWASRKNLDHYGLSEKALAIADARELPFEGMHAVATDPPYGKLSTTRGASSIHLIRDFLGSALDGLCRGGFLCLASNRSPDQFGLENDGRMEVVESHEAPVNSSLVRHVTVARRR